MSRGPFARLCVVGLGLLGGSVALAARRRGAAVEVVGATRNPAARERALAEGMVDRVAPLAEAARGADLVLLATPVGAMAATLRELSSSLEEGALVTDVGSVKAPLEETLPGLIPPGCEYVGSHPMAGSHARGVEHARADLLEGSVCVVVGATGPSPARQAAEARVVAFWEALGARVLRRSAGEHDRQVAWSSHLPHLLAFAFGGGLAEAPAAAAELAGAGFRDFSRIARSDPALWADILCSNRKALAAPLGAATATLGEFGRALEAGDAEALERLLSAAREALWEAPTGGSASPCQTPDLPENPDDPEPGEPDPSL